MKLTAFILLIACTTVNARNGYGQKVSLSENKAPLKRVFHKIEKQTNYQFLFFDADLKKAHHISLHIENAALQDVLKQVFQNQPLTYSIKDKIIVVRHKPLAISSLTDVLPNILISGQVKDSATGNPLAGVTIKVKSENTGTVTDTEGKFSLEVPDDAVLVVSYLGYEPKEISVDGKTDFNISLAAATTGLNQLVVVGYGVQKKQDVTGAISQIKPKDLDMVTKPSVAQMLLGTASGVTVQQTSAQPGGGVNIYIRGEPSTGAANSPLIVIDGFPVSDGGVEPGSGNRYSYGSRNPLNSINPHDIESIEVLKDAAATAIYGSRAGNGVILITTKRGKKGKPKVSYNFSRSFQKITKKLHMLNATEYMKTANEEAYERWLFDNTIFPYGNTAPENAKTPYMKPHTDAQIAHAGEGTDWWRLVTRTGNIRQHNLSIMGGSEYTKYAVTGNYFNQEGVLKHNNFKRYSVRTNIEQKLGKIFTTGLNLTLSRVDNQNFALGDGLWENSGTLTDAIQYPSIYPVYDVHGNYFINSVYSSMANPVSLLEMTDNTTTKRVLGTIFLEAKVLEGLKANVNFGIDNRLGKRDQYVPKSVIFGATVNGQASISQIEKFDKKLTATLNYTKHIHEVHSIDALVGYEYTYFDATGFNAEEKDFFTDIFLYYNLGGGNPATSKVGSYRAPSNELASYFARLNYSFADKYYVTLTGRYDGSSKFGANNKWAFFPAVAFKWRVIKEVFMKALTPVSDLAFRLSWGKSGNQNIGQNAFSYYSSGFSYNFGVPGSVYPGVVLSQIENPNLKWETSTTLNFGVDFGVFKDRITGTIEVYRKVVDGLLSSRELPSWYPVSSVADNIGSTQDKGIEVTLDTRNLDGAFKWNTHFVLSHFKDTWRNRNANVILAPYEHTNDPLRPQWTYLFDGILQIGEEPPVAQPLLLPGQEKIKDVSGLDKNGKQTGVPDGKIDIADIVLAGTTDPSMTIGLGNTFQYKNLDLTIFFNGMFGRKAVQDANWTRWGVGVLNMINQGFNLMSDVKNRWTHDHPSATMMSGMPSLYHRSNNGFWFNGNFVRCRNITLGYRFPDLQKVFSSLRVYIDVNNVFVITKYPYMDPETNSMAGYPNQRSYSVGFDVNF